MAIFIIRGDRPMTSVIIGIQTFEMFINNAKRIKIVCKFQVPTIFSLRITLKEKKIGFVENRYSLNLTIFFSVLSCDLFKRKKCRKTTSYRLRPIV